jgi:hypothetical protein
LGGGLFGLVSGCTAASVSSALGRAEGRNQARKEWNAGPASDTEPTTQQRPAPAPSTNLLYTQAELDGIKVFFLARPQTGSATVGLRFQRRTRNSMFDECNELEMAIDGQSKRYPWVRKRERSGSRIIEAVQVEIDIDTVRAMRAARAVDFRLCAVQRRLTLEAVKAADVFVTRFDALAPKWRAPSAPDQPAQTPPAESAPVATEAPVPVPEPVPAPGSVPAPSTTTTAPDPVAPSP